MTEVFFSVNKWSAWAPGLISTGDFKDWASGLKDINKDFSLIPEVEKIPAMQRRRLSQLTKSSLKVALDLTENGENIPSIFSSRYGEWSQTLKLLQSLSAGEGMSPAGFSMSVHNTAAGAYSIINQNKAPYIALAGGDKTFDSSILEAISRLKKEEKILVVIAEENMPELYSEVFDEQIIPFALGLIIEKGEDFKVKLSNNKTKPIHPLDFLKWMLGDKNKPIESNLFSISHA